MNAAMAARGSTGRRRPTTGHLRRDPLCYSRGMRKGVLLGAANAFVLSIWLSAVPEALTSGQAFFYAWIFFGIPILLVGLVLGGVGSAMTEFSRAVRFGVIAALALLAVVGIAVVFDGFKEVLPFAVPALANAHLLERWTRKVSPIPVARSISADS